MENEGKILINDKENLNRHTAYDALPETIKEYSNRVAYNTKLMFAELIKRKIYPDYSSLNKENLEVIYKAVQYFDIGFAFKVGGVKNKSILPVKHVNYGGDVFFADIKSRDDFKALTAEEKRLRTLAKDVATYHHEQWDGKGYPLGLRMEEIPITARICSLCLGFEELTNGKKINIIDRYSAINKLQSLSGTKYDPELVELMLDILPTLAVKGDPQVVTEPKITLEEEKVEEAKKEEKPEEIIKEQPLTDDNEDGSNKKRKASRPVELLFSPVQDLKLKKMECFKTTLVINDRYYGAMKPVLYASVAEKTGKMTELVLIGIEQAIEFIKLADKYEVQHGGVLFRLYPSVVEKPKNLLKVINAVKKSEIDPSKLIFEIPESTMASEDERIKANLDLIRFNKIRIAITDFGVSYSSLSKISELEFDYLIIGHNFIKNITVNSKYGGIVRSIVDLVKNIGVKEICEKVQSVEQLEVLKKIGCRLIEGPVIGELLNKKEELS